MRSFFSFSGCALLFLLAAAGLASCSKTNASNPAAATASVSDSVTGFLITGNWIINAMSEKKEDNTQSFSGYLFTFSADGKLVITKNGTTVKGTWHHTPAVTYYGASSKDAISINTGTADPFRRLTKTWNLTSASSTGIQLDNPETDEDEHLHFQKQ